MTCSVGGCERAHYAHGWCNMHYQRWYKNGDPLVRRREAKPTRRCSIEGCDRKHMGHGFCELHWKRWRATGDVGPVGRLRAPNGTHRTMSSGGYPKLYAPEHPLADSTGYLYEHRKVWFDANGPIPDGCHVHHVDGDKTNNDLANLAVLSESDHHKLHAAAGSDMEVAAALIAEMLVEFPEARTFAEAPVVEPRIP